MPLMGYLQGGGFYPVGTSQKISDAFVGLIKKNGGEVKLNTKVEKILDPRPRRHRRPDGRRRGVPRPGRHLERQRHRHLRPDDARRGGLPQGPDGADGQVSPSAISTFLVWLGLKTDLVRKVGLKESEIFYHTELRHRGRVQGRPWPEACRTSRISG
ncbi:MAG: hypothetical protein M0C28_12995 [Candidatus Moduliflexus flocculans]|nr:hypothetical protein [Candidatus Moduliflexus flocculans]